MNDEQIRKDDVIKFDIDVVYSQKPILKEKMSILMTDELVRKFDNLSVKLMIERGYSSVDEITPAEIIAILDECRTEEK